MSKMASTQIALFNRHLKKLVHNYGRFGLDEITQPIVHNMLDSSSEWVAITLTLACLKAKGFVQPATQLILFKNNMHAS